MAVQEIRAVEFFELNNIPYVTTGNEHCRQGWIQVSCPFCGDPDFHLGYNIAGNYFSCYRCGSHHLSATLHALTSCGHREAKNFETLFFRKSSQASASTSEISNEIVRPTICTLPSNVQISKNKTAWRYLSERFPQFNDDEFAKMCQTYDLRATNWMYVDEKGSSALANRVVIPNYYNGKIVSYQCRDYTGWARSAYITAKPEKEVMFHKDFLWGMDYVPYNKVIVNEGVMDSLTIGHGALHTHGVNFSQQQAECLYMYDEVFIVYDTDKPGILGAKKLANMISHRVKVKIVTLSQHDVNTCGVQEIQDLRGLIYG